MASSFYYIFLSIFLSFHSGISAEEIPVVLEQQNVNIWAERQRSIDTLYCSINTNLHTQYDMIPQRRTATKKQIFGTEKCQVSLQLHLLKDYKKKRTLCFYKEPVQRTILEEDVSMELEGLPLTIKELHDNTNPVSGFIAGEPNSLVQGYLIKKLVKWFYGTIRMYDKFRLYHVIFYVEPISNVALYNPKYAKEELPRRNKDNAVIFEYISHVYEKAVWIHCDSDLHTAKEASAKGAFAKEAFAPLLGFGGQENRAEENEPEEIEYEEKETSTTTTTVELSAAPTPTTAATVKLSAAPTPTSATTVELSAAPTPTTSTTVKLSAAPTRTTAAMVKLSAAPTPTTAATVKLSAAPTPTTAATVELSAAPTPTTAAMVKLSAAPTPTTATKVKLTAAPTPTTATKVKLTAAPTPTTAAMVELSAAPTPTTAATVELSAAPTPTTAATVELSAAPTPTTAAMVELSAAPIHSTAPREDLSLTHSTVPREDLSVTQSTVPQEVLLVTYSTEVETDLSATPSPTSGGLNKAVRIDMAFWNTTSSRKTTQTKTTTPVEPVHSTTQIVLNTTFPHHSTEQTPPIPPTTVLLHHSTDLTLGNTTLPEHSTEVTLLYVTTTTLSTTLLLDHSTDLTNPSTTFTTSTTPTTSTTLLPPQHSTEATTPTVTVTYTHSTEHFTATETPPVHSTTVTLENKPPFHSTTLIELQHSTEVATPSPKTFGYYNHSTEQTLASSTSTTSTTQSTGHSPLPTFMTHHSTIATLYGSPFHSTEGITGVIHSTEATPFASTTNPFHSTELFTESTRLPTTTTKTTITTTLPTTTTTTTPTSTTTTTPTTTTGAWLNNVDELQEGYSITVYGLDCEPLEFTVNERNATHYVLKSGKPGVLIKLLRKKNVVVTHETVGELYFFVTDADDDSLLVRTIRPAIEEQIKPIKCSSFVATRLDQQEISGNDTGAILKGYVYENMYQHFLLIETQGNDFDPSFINFCASGPDNLTYLIKNVTGTLVTLERYECPYSEFIASTEAATSRRYYHSTDSPRLAAEVADTVYIVYPDWMNKSPEGALILSKNNSMVVLEIETEFDEQVIGRKVTVENATGEFLQKGTIIRIDGKIITIEFADIWLEAAGPEHSTSVYDTRHSTDVNTPPTAAPTSTTTSSPSSTVTLPHCTTVLPIPLHSTVVPTAPSRPTTTTTESTTTTTPTFAVPSHSTRKFTPLYHSTTLIYPPTTSTTTSTTPSTTTPPSTSTTTVPHSTEVPTPRHHSTAVPTEPPEPPTPSTTTSTTTTTTTTTTTSTTTTPPPPLTTLPTTVTTREPLASPVHSTQPSTASTAPHHSTRVTTTTPEPYPDENPQHGEFVEIYNQSCIPHRGRVRRRNETHAAIRLDDITLSFQSLVGENVLGLSQETLRGFFMQIQNLYEDTLIVKYYFSNTTEMMEIRPVICEFTRITYPNKEETVLAGRIVRKDVDDSFSIDPSYNDGIDKVKAGDLVEFQGVYFVVDQKEGHLVVLHKPVTTSSTVLHSTRPMFVHRNFVTRSTQSTSTSSPEPPAYIFSTELFVPLHSTHNYSSFTNATTTALPTMLTNHTVIFSTEQFPRTTGKPTPSHPLHSTGEGHNFRKPTTEGTTAGTTVSTSMGSAVLHSTARAGKKGRGLLNNKMGLKSLAQPITKTNLSRSVDPVASEKKFKGAPKETTYVFHPSTEILLISSPPAISTTHPPPSTTSSELIFVFFPSTEHELPTKPRVVSLRNNSGSETIGNAPKLINNPYAVSSNQRDIALKGEIARKNGNKIMMNTKLKEGTADFKGRQNVNLDFKDNAYKVVSNGPGMGRAVNKLVLPKVDQAAQETTLKSRGVFKEMNKLTAKPLKTYIHPIEQISSAKLITAMNSILTNPPTNNQGNRVEPNLRLPLPIYAVDSPPYNWTGEASVANLGKLPVFSTEMPTIQEFIASTEYTITENSVDEERDEKEKPRRKRDLLFNYNKFFGENAIETDLEDDVNSRMEFEGGRSATDIFDLRMDKASVCQLCVWVQPNFAQIFGFGASVLHGIAEIIDLIKFTDWIFRAIDFNQDGLAENIGFRIKRILMKDSVKVTGTKKSIQENADESKEKDDSQGKDEKSQENDSTSPENEADDANGEGSLDRKKRQEIFKDYYENAYEDESKKLSMELNGPNKGVLDSKKSLHKKMEALFSNFATEIKMVEPVEALLQVADSLHSEFPDCCAVLGFMYHDTVPAISASTERGLCSSSNLGLTSGYLHSHKLTKFDVFRGVMHALGHLFGASHDDTTDADCQDYQYYHFINPFLSHPIQQMNVGMRPNSFRYSPCAKDEITSFLASNNPKCLITDVSEFCGNGRVDKDESCDCGSPWQCHLAYPCCGEKDVYLGCQVINPTKKSCYRPTIW